MLCLAILHLVTRLVKLNCGKLLLKLPLKYIWRMRASASDWRKRRRKSRILKHHLKRQTMDYVSRYHVSRN